MTLAILLTFSGLDRDGMCSVLLLQLCLVTSGKVFIFHNVSVCMNFFKKPGLQWYSRHVVLLKSPLLFLFPIFLFAAQPKKLFLDGLKKLEKQGYKHVELRREYVE
jgi:hypothetical protein